MDDTPTQPALPRELRETLEKLLPLPRDQRVPFEMRVARIIEEFQTDCLIQGMSGHPKVNRKNIEKLASSLRTAVSALHSLPPDYEVAIAALATREVTPELVDLQRLEIGMVLLGWAQTVSCEHSNQVPGGPFPTPSKKQ